MIFKKKKDLIVFLCVNYIFLAFIGNSLKENAVENSVKNYVGNSVENSVDNSVKNSGEKFTENSA